MQLWLLAGTPVAVAAAVALKMPLRQRQMEELCHTNLTCLLPVNLRDSQPQSMPPLHLGLAQHVVSHPPDVIGSEWHHGPNGNGCYELLFPF